ncbi:hypothetical protein PR048_011111 [Dryococelus australis]|uniref:Uncharacterized protein n=1 Tax=Dryococelus australis TaxID=614101 RepID=A0ABQ9HKV7_9NEOP|nr:hypothetical protein PR048_011111 [Dryococelus australis]
MEEEDGDIITSFVYETPVDMDIVLAARIIVICDVIHNTHGIFEQVWQNIIYHCHACFEVGEGELGVELVVGRKEEGSRAVRGVARGERRRVRVWKGSRGCQRGIGWDDGQVGKGSEGKRFGWLLTMRTTKVKLSENGAVPECKGRRNGRAPSKPIDQRHRPARFALAKIQERPSWGMNPVHLGGRQAKDVLIPPRAVFAASCLSHGLEKRVPPPPLLGLSGVWVIVRHRAKDEREEKRVALEETSGRKSVTASIGIVKCVNGRLDYWTGCCPVFREKPSVHPSGCLPSSLMKDVLSRTSVRSSIWACARVIAGWEAPKRNWLVMTEIIIISLAR